MRYTLAQYLLDNYGRCAAEVCVCRQRGPWLGTLCPYWVTMGAMTWEKLREEQRKLHESP